VDLKLALIMVFTVKTDFLPTIHILEEDHLLFSLKF